MNSENINEKHEKDMERIRALRIIDDQFIKNARKTPSDVEATTYFLFRSRVEMDSASA